MLYEWADCIRSEFGEDGPAARVLIAVEEPGEYAYGAYSEGLPDALPRDLFLRFARLEETEESMAEFANTFAPLGISNDEPRFTSLEGGLPFEGETLDEWRRCINEARAALRLFEDLADSARLAKVCGAWEWMGGMLRVRLGKVSASPRDTRFRYERYFEIPVGGGDDGRNPAAGAARRDFRRAALHVLRSMANGYLAGHTQNAVLWDSTRSAFTIYPQPITTLGVMWAQFARMLTGEEGLVLCACRTCGQAFLAKRADAQSCSASCRVTRSRRNQRATHQKGGK